MVRPHQYKKLARRKTIKYVMIWIFMISIIIPGILQVSNSVDFKYLGPPRRSGCTLILFNESYYIYIGVFLLVTIGVNLTFLGTYLVLHFNFKTLINVSAEMLVLKKGSLLITSMTAVSYLVGYTPGTVVYIIICMNPNLIMDLGFPYNIILDTLLKFTPHLKSCIIPMFLVSGPTMKRLKKAADVTRNTYRMRINENEGIADNKETNAKTVRLTGMPDKRYTS